MRDVNELRVNGVALRYVTKGEVEQMESTTKVVVHAQNLAGLNFSHCQAQI